MYKVISIHHGRKTSAITKYLYYEKGEWTVPKFGKIFIFMDLKLAISFKKKYCFNGEVWSCEAEDVEKIYKVASYQFNDKDFWNGEDVRTFPAPEGSFVASRVKLLTKID